LKGEFISSSKNISYRIFCIGEITKLDKNRHEIKVFKAYEDALYKIENYQELRILYFMDKLEKNGRSILQVHPRNNKENPLRGVFSTHSPVRPNPIGVTEVELIERNANILIVKGLDALDNSPLIDIKSK